MKQCKRLSALLLSVVVLLSAAGCQKAGPGSEQERFDAFIEREFVETMESDYTTAHVFLQDPKSFGVDVSNTTVGLGVRYDEESQKSAKEALKASYEEFLTFDRDKLTEEQQDTYDIYKYQAELSHQMSDDKFDYYEPVFQSMSGLHYQLPTLFADWDLRSEQDVQDMIVMLEDVLPYVQSALDYTRRQEELGLLMLDLDSVLEYCQTIVDSGENSAVLTAMQENVAALSLGEEKTEQYQKQLKEAFVSSFLPAYQQIGDVMKEFVQSGENNTEGLSKFENGKAYYELLLQQSIGSNKSVDEIKEMMQEKFSQHLENLQKVMMENLNAVQPLITGELPETDYESYDDILKEIQSRLFEDFPQVNDLNYNIKDINEEIASSSGVAAYFNIPPLDGESTKQLRVNPISGDVSSIYTYSTVAHEGFPGHMYQYAYMYENLDSNYRKALANVGAYTEGYSVYAQYEAFRYLDGIEEALLQAFKENELASYCIIILADIGIHYEGWSIQEFMEFCNSNGFAMDEESAELQYKQLQANPCAFQPYYVGYHEIDDLKADAQEELGNRFDEKAFHEALLKSGTAPFEVVERNIDEYIESAR